jgi:ABC-2 type transport system ATP-binding protein
VSVLPTPLAAPSAPSTTTSVRVPGRAAMELTDVSQRFGRTEALRGVSLAVQPGEIHCLLGPNGAGKTTLLRVLSGLLVPTEGTVRVIGGDPAGGPRSLRQRVGLVPAGDRSFYLRLSGLENLAFFARLHGLRRRDAVARARDALTWVGLADAERRPVGVYSHGMQKRLSVARALLADPAVLLVDEATHDLDPDGAARVRELVADTAARGTAVVWATQRLDEIRGFAHTATVLRQGTARFAGTVADLLEHAVYRSYVVRLGRDGGMPPTARLQVALGGVATVEEGADGQQLLTLAEGTAFSDAVMALGRLQVRVVSCRPERSDVEEAFFSLVGRGR